MLGITRQGISKRRKSQRQKEALIRFLEGRVKSVRLDHKRMGLRKIFYKMSLFRYMGVNRFEHLFQELGYGVDRGRRRIFTTDSRNTERYYDNLVNGLVIRSCNQLIVGDITYYMVGDTTYYICFLVDVYSLRIVGHGVDLNMKKTLCMEAVERVKQLRGINSLTGTIHHTDKGSQYGSLAYVGMVTACKMTMSMAKNCLENGYAERINGIIKQEYLDFYKIGDLTEMKKRLERSVYLYNYERPVKRLGYLSPVEFESGREPKTRVKNKVKLYDFT